MPYERKTKDIFISDELKNILEEIESESLVAHLLLKKRHPKEDLVDDNVNYISISTQDRGRISYLTKDRMEAMSEDEYWNSTRRYHTKPGGFVAKVFNGIPPKEVEKFSNLFRAEADKPDFRFEVVNGERIRRVYHYESVDSDCGSLGISCMKHDHCQKYLDIYVNNADKISMLVMYDEDDLVIGRALLWHFDSFKLMDRIYTVNDEKYSSYFKKWCIKNGYLHKSEQNWYNTLAFEQFGQKRSKLQLKLSLTDKHFEYYPYMDTFKFIDNDGNLYNYHPPVNFKTLCSTDGRKQYSDYLRFDVIDEVFRYPGDTVWLEYRDCYTHFDNCYYSESNDCHIVRADSTYNEEARDYIFNEENDSYNNKERIQGRIDYYKEREEARKKAQKKKVLDNAISTAYDIESVVGFTETLNLFNNYITDRFSTRVVVNRRQDDEPQSEPDTTEPEATIHFTSEGTNDEITMNVDCSGEETDLEF